MPVLRISDKVQFAFDDSGAPARSPYRTVVLIHGLQFNKSFVDIFKKMYPLAGRFNVRLISVDRRGYGKTSPITADEWRMVESGTEADFLKYIKGQALELGQFIAALVKQQSLEKVSVVGWSLASIWIGCLLAFSHELPAPDFQVLESHLTDFIFHDAPTPTMTEVVEGYTPLRDDSILGQDRARAFALWVSGYCKHPDPTKVAGCVQRIEDYRKDRHSTLETMSPGDLSECADDEMNREAIVIAKGWEHGFWPNAKRIFSSKNLPHAFFTWISCEESIWECVLCPALVKEDLKAAKEEGLEIRDCNWKVLRGANHFVHWDSPSDALGIFTFAK